MPTLGTFNIRLFPDRGTDPHVVAQRLVDLDVDVLMVQEIRDGAAFDAVLGEASTALGRDYAVRLGPMCAGSDLQLGVVYDRKRYREVEHRVQRQLDPQGRCSCREGHPPATLVVLDSVKGGPGLAALSVHLQYGGRRWMLRARRDQWEHLVACMDELRTELGLPLAVAGDFNSTGYVDDDRGERRFMQAMIEASGMVHATADVPCTAYWRPNRRTKDYVPSMLDHILLSQPPKGPVKVLGMAAAHQGQIVPGDDYVEDFHIVSDHCPLRVEWPLDDHAPSSA